MAIGDIQPTSGIFSPANDGVYRRIAEIRNHLEGCSLPPFAKKKLKKELRELTEKVSPRWGH